MVLQNSFVFPVVFSISVSSVIHHHVICVICGSFLAFRHLSIGVAHFRAFSDRNPVGTGRDGVASHKANCSQQVEDSKWSPELVRVGTQNF